MTTNYEELPLRTVTVFERASSASWVRNSRDGPLPMNLPMNLLRTERYERLELQFPGHLRS